MVAFNTLNIILLMGTLLVSPWFLVAQLLLLASAFTDIWWD